jgi:hypothetical protein
VLTIPGLEKLCQVILAKLNINIAPKAYEVGGRTLFFPKYYNLFTSIYIFIPYVFSFIWTYCLKEKKTGAKVL